MKKINKLIITLLIFSIAPLFAHDGKHSAASEGQADPFIQLMLDQVKFLEGRLVSLAEAIPAEKYSWAPSEGVRNTGAHFVHMLTASYGIPSMMGAKMPDHINWEIEKTITEKAEIVKHLKTSFDDVAKFLKGYDTANYEKMVKTPFGEYTQRTMILIINNHYHEHLGSLITHARAVGVTPPWSEKKEEPKGE